MNVNFGAIGSSSTDPANGAQREDCRGDHAPPAGAARCSHWRSCCAAVQRVEHRAASRPAAAAVSTAPISVCHRVRVMAGDRSVRAPGQFDEIEQFGDQRGIVGRTCRTQLADDVPRARRGPGGRDRAACRSARHSAHRQGPARWWSVAAGNRDQVEWCGIQLTHLLETGVEQGVECAPARRRRCGAQDRRCRDDRWRSSVCCARGVNAPFGRDAVSDCAAVLRGVEAKTTRRNSARRCARTCGARSCCRITASAVSSAPAAGAGSGACAVSTASQKTRMSSC